MDQPTPELVNCPACGVKNPAAENLCAACGTSLIVVIGPRPKVRHVGLGSVMIFIAVVAACLAPIRVAPGLSVLLAILFIPTTVRGLIALERQRLDGRPADAYQALGWFVESFIIVFYIAMAALIAFVATCFPIGAATLNLHDPRRFPPGLMVAFGAGTISGLVAMYLVGKKRWRWKD